MAKRHVSVLNRCIHLLEKVENLLDNCSTDSLHEEVADRWDALSDAVNECILDVVDLHSELDAPTDERAIEPPMPM